MFKASVRIFTSMNYEVIHDEFTSVNFEELTFQKFIINKVFRLPAHKAKILVL